MKYIANKDPTGQGLSSPIAFRLLLALLSWDEHSRPTAQEALNHAFFVVPLHRQSIRDLQCKQWPEKGWC